METLYKVLGLIGAGLIIWYLYHTIKNRPDLFSRENVSKSFSSMGVLALILIVFVAILVLILRNT
jgi:ABC-type phosphate/phosphonate transport system permease subunit